MYVENTYVRPDTCYPCIRAYWLIYEVWALDTSGFSNEEYACRTCGCITQINGELEMYSSSFPFKIYEYSIFNSRNSRICMRIQPKYPAHVFLSMAPWEKLHETEVPKISKNNPFAEIRCFIDWCAVELSAKREPRKGGIPRRHKPVVQQQGHRVQGVQAEPKELGRQNLDNQEWRRCLHNSG